MLLGGSGRVRDPGGVPAIDASGWHSRVRRFRDMGDACLEVVAVVGAVGAVEVHTQR